MKSLIIGYGQVGQALHGILSNTYEVLTRDMVPDRHANGVECLHICYPYSDRFVKMTADYIREYAASLCIIHSTVVPGTTVGVQKQTVCNIAYSPVRGRHGQMQADMLKYTKFVGAPVASTVIKTSSYLSKAGFTVQASPSARVLELAKLLETSYSGLLIGWAQEMKRYCDEIDVSLSDALALTDEVDYLPRYEFYPGHIGGHCITMNLDLLEEVLPSNFIDAIRKSNGERHLQAMCDGEDLTTRHLPKLRI